MGIPFTVEQFLDVFARYNVAIWPMQVVAYVLGIAAIFFAVRKTGYSDRFISAILAFYWLWFGILFNMLYWSKLWSTAFIFGILAIIQGLLFLFSGVIKPHISFSFKLNTYAIIGIILMVYAMIGYPAIGSFFGRVYPQSPAFGLVPCPTAVYTFGLFLWTDKNLPKYLLIIPLIVAIAGLAAIFMGVYEDVGLVVGGILGTILIFTRDKKLQ
jgi:hypothetical protein